MSVANVKGFFEKVEKDEVLQRKLKALAEAQDKAMLAELVKIAEDAGFKFTAADYVEARRQKAGELSADEIAKLRSGGRGCPDLMLMHCRILVV